MKTAAVVFTLLAAVSRTRTPSLGSACDGAWKEVEDAAAALVHLDRQGSTDAGRQKMLCLLRAINETRFDARDSGYDQVLANQAIRVLVGVYGPANYDFFAAQLNVQTDRVRRGLLGALIERGHPEALEEYFAIRRKRLGEAGSLPANVAAPAVFKPLVERGMCVAPLCSRRLEETLQVIDTNLDLLTMELKANAVLQPVSTSIEEVRRVAQVRADSRDLLAMIERIRRGEATIGKIR